MNCPHCQSQDTKLHKPKTQLGYQQFRCRQCFKQFNERTATPFNFIEYPSEIVMLAVHYYYRFKTSLSDVVELMALRGVNLSHQTIHNWAQTFGVELGLKLRERRRCRSGNKWHVDSTYLKIEGRWCYFYRAIDSDGRLVDVYLSDVRDQKAAESFFKQALKTSDVEPSQITTDKEAALYPAIKNVFKDRVTHRDSKYKNNIIEQDHRGIKSRYGVLKGFKNIFSAQIFCTAFEEIRSFFRDKIVSRSKNPRIIASKFNELCDLAMASK